MSKYIKSCSACTNKFKNLSDIVDSKCRFTVSKKGELWFDCLCGSTLYIPMERIVNQNLGQDDYYCYIDKIYNQGIKEKNIHKHSRSVLILDDNKAILDVINLGISKLNGFDFTSVTASNGSQGLKLCKKFKFDAIIVDYLMPEMNGIEFIKEFRKLSECKSIPIILTSGNYRYNDFKNDINCFDDDIVFIEKPFSISQILTYLKNSLSAYNNHKIDLNPS